MPRFPAHGKKYVNNPVIQKNLLNRSSTFTLFSHIHSETVCVANLAGSELNFQNTPEYRKRVGENKISTRNTSYTSGIGNGKVQNIALISVRRWKVQGLLRGFTRATFSPCSEIRDNGPAFQNEYNSIISAFLQSTTP